MAHVMFIVVQRDKHTSDQELIWTHSWMQATHVQLTTCTGLLGLTVESEYQRLVLRAWAG